MEKGMWLGAVLGLSLVLLVFAVGYSAGNSPTGYGFFDFFKFNKRQAQRQTPVPEVLPPPVEVEERTCACNVEVIDLDETAEGETASLRVNGEMFNLLTGDRVVHGACLITFVDEIDDEALLDINGRLRSIGVGEDECTDRPVPPVCDGCDVRVTDIAEDERGDYANLYFDIDSNIIRLYTGDRVVSGAGRCSTTLLDVDMESDEVMLETGGNIYTIDSLESHCVEGGRRISCLCSVVIDDVAYTEAGEAVVRTIIDGETLILRVGDSTVQGNCTVEVLATDANDVLLNVNGLTDVMYEGNGRCVTEAFSGFR